MFGLAYSQASPTSRSRNASNWFWMVASISGLGARSSCALASAAQTDRPIARMIRFAMDALRAMVARRTVGAKRPASIRHQPPGQPVGDERLRLLDAIERDEPAEARSLACAHQHLVERREPRAQRLEPMKLADGEDDGLQEFLVLPVHRRQIGLAALLRVLARDHVERFLGILEAGGKLLHRRAFLIGGRAEHLGWLHEIVVVAHGEPRRRVEVGMRAGACLGRVAADEAPKRLLVLGMRHG